jgi:hypothetical protein
MKQIELTSKLVVALIAIVVVFSAMTVPSVVAQSTTSPPIRANSVTSGSIKDGEVKTADLADGAVTSAKIADGTIQEQDIADGVIPDGGGALPSVHIVKSGFVTVPPQGLSVGELDCPSGEKLTGGGFDAFTSGEVTENFPADEDTWHVAVANNRDVESLFSVYAICIGPSP